MSRFFTAMRLSEFFTGLLISLSLPVLAAQARPQSATSAFEEAQNAQQRGDLALAVRLYTSAISAEPTLFQAYYQRATALVGLGREREAEADLRKVLELEPRFARAHRTLGQILLDRGMTKDARREFARAIEIDPKLGGVRIYYASALIKDGELQSAIENLRAAIGQGEATPLAYALLGVAAERLAKPDEAFSHYSRAIETDPTNAIAREGRARLFEGRGELAKAIEDYSLAYRAQPSPPLAMKLAGLHARAGQPQAAIQLYRGLLRERPDDLTLRAELARLMAENGQAEDAIKDVERLLAAQPNDAKLLTLMADLLFKEKPQLATGYYRRALEADPNNNHVRVQLGAALVRSTDYQAALPVLAEAINREPNDYAAHANLATALFKLRQYPQAAREFTWILRARPEIAAGYYFLAISLDRMGDCEQAMRAYQEFVRRADPVANKSEVEEASIRLGLLQKLAKDGKCKTLAKGKGK